MLFIFSFFLAWHMSSVQEKLERAEHSHKPSRTIRDELYLVLFLVILLVIFLHPPVVKFNQQWELYW